MESKQSSRNKSFGSFPSLGLGLGLSLGAIAALASCTATMDGDFTDPVAESSQELSVAQHVELRDGRLVFDSSDHFNAFMEEVINQEEESLDGIEQELGFLSMRTYYGQEKERAAEYEPREDEEVDFDAPVEDPYFATALNPDGYIQVGDEVRIVTETHVYNFPEELLPELEALEELTPESAATVGAEVYEVERASAIQGKAGGLGTMATSNCAVFYSQSGTTFRMRGRSYITWWWFYTSAGLWTDHDYRKKHTFLWWTWWTWSNDNAERVGFSGDFWFTLNGTPWFSGPVFRELINTHRVSRVLAWVVGFPAAPDLRGQIASAHWSDQAGFHAQCNQTVSR